MRDARNERREGAEDRQEARHGHGFAAILWVGGLVTLGYFFGNVPFIKTNLSLLVVGIILLSLVPMIIGVIRSRMGRAPAKAKA